MCLVTIGLVGCSNSSDPVKAEINANEVTPTPEVKEQHQEASRLQIANEIDLASYDVVFLGYPIWWNDTPRIIQTLIETGCLDGKVVVPFCTSESSSIDLSEYTLVSYEGIDWQKGSRLEVSESSVHDWLESLK